MAEWQPFTMSTKVTWADFGPADKLARMLCKAKTEELERDMNRWFDMEEVRFFLIKLRAAFPREEE